MTSSNIRSKLLALGALLGAWLLPGTLRAQSARRFEFLPAGGIHLLGAQRVSLALGVLAVPSSSDSRYAFVALAEPGIGGAKIRAGLASVTAFITGYELQGSVLRTFGSPRQADPWRTYVGGEAHAMFVLINLGLGVYAPLGGGRGTLTTFSIGLGL